MKIFEGKESSWSDKVNFVDGNDVFVGYDLGQCCCENADWFISEKITPYTYDSDDDQKETPCMKAIISTKSSLKMLSLLT